MVLRLIFGGLPFYELGDYVVKKVFSEEKKYAFALCGEKEAGKTMIRDLLFNNDLKKNSLPTMYWNENVDSWKIFGFDTGLFDTFSILDVSGDREKRRLIDGYLDKKKNRRRVVIYVFDAREINDENWENFKMRVDSVARWYENNHNAKFKLIGTRDGALKPEQKKRLNAEFGDGIKLVEFFPRDEVLSKNEKESLRDEIIAFIKDI